MHPFSLQNWLVGPEITTLGFYSNVYLLSVRKILANYRVDFGCEEKFNYFQESGTKLCYFSGNQVKQHVD